MAPKRRRRPNDVDDDVPKPDRRQAGSKVFDMLMDMYSQCSIVTAKDVCILCYYMHLAGAEGAYFEDFGLDPGHQSGKYRHHLNRMLPTTCPTVRVCVPSYVRGKSHQASRTVPFMLTYASIAKEVEQAPTVSDLLENGDYDNPTAL